MNFNENDLLTEKTELLYLRISKLARAKVLVKLEFDTEDQVLFTSKKGVLFCGSLGKKCKLKDYVIHEHSTKYF